MSFLNSFKSPSGDKFPPIAGSKALARAASRLPHAIANLTQVTTADGGDTQLTWSGGSITSLVTYSHGAGLSRTRYGYDGSHRVTRPCNVGFRLLH